MASTNSARYPPPDSHHQSAAYSHSFVQHFPEHLYSEADASNNVFTRPPRVDGQRPPRSESISSVRTTGSRNFSRPVIMYPAAAEPSSLQNHVKQSSHPRKAVDSAVVSPLYPDQWAQQNYAPNNSGHATGDPILNDAYSNQWGARRLDPAHGNDHPGYANPPQPMNRKSSGILGGNLSNSQSRTSSPRASEGVASMGSRSHDFGLPVAELSMDMRALSVQDQPHQHTVQQHPQIHDNPHVMMPEVAVYHASDPSQPQYGLGRQAELVGEPGPMFEDSIEQLPEPRYPAQYSQPYGSSLNPGVHISAESISRPRSTNTLESGSNSDGRPPQHKGHLSAGGSPSPGASPMLRPQLHTGKHSPENRPQSYMDLLQTPYAQQVAPSPNLDNSFLRQIVGKNASLQEASKTLDAYRANVKNIADPAIQYEFAIFMIQTALELPPDARGPISREDLVKDARQILQKLADKAYPFAQYYLADGYASGLFNKGKEDYDRAFPLFQAASKRGHAESAYRAALCYELGWGCRKDYAKAVKFYEMSASKNHPGAATRLGLASLNNMMGLSGKYREGSKWLKRAAESADAQYNAAPYELAKLHENGFGPDIFKDEAYAAQLFTQSANLGHPDANLVMGKAYEHGYLGCPQDAMLSIHFYTGAANAGEPEGMMALCAWYLFGAPPLLEKDDCEAFEWAQRAADCGFAKAEYAVGYFKEMGIGCRQDTMEANHWYWRAAQQGEERAKQRMRTIEQAVSGGTLQDEHKTRKGLFGRKLAK